MVTLRAFATLASGLLFILAVQAMLAALARLSVPSWRDSKSAGSALVTLGSAFLAGAAGGFCAAWMAATNPLGYVMVLAIAVLILAGLTAVQQRGRMPLALQLLLIALMPLGVLAGGLIRLRMWGWF